jgi:hypothetical protein
MNNMSLARIMYGTNEDFHATTSMYRPTVPLRAIATMDNRHEAASTHGTLTGLLYKVWARIKA